MLNYGAVDKVRGNMNPILVNGRIEEAESSNGYSGALIKDFGVEITWLSRIVQAINV